MRRHRARLNALGYVTGSGTAPHQGPYTEKDDPKRLLAIDQRIHDAIDLFQRGDARSAAAIYRDLIAQRPDMATGYEHLAFVAWEIGSAGGGDRDAATGPRRRRGERGD